MSSVGAFAVSTRDEGDAFRLILSGELDRVTLPTLARALAAADDSARTTVILDCRDLRFIDLGGVRTIIGAAQRLRAKARRLVLTEVPPMIRRLFRLAAAEESFDLIGEVRIDRHRPRITDPS